jgi:hypothetical protein
MSGWQADPRHAVRRLEASHSYGVVLGLIVVCFMFTAASPDERWSRAVIVVLNGLTLLAGLWVAGTHCRVLHAATIAVLVALVIAFASLAKGTEVSLGVVGLISGLMIALTPIAIVRGMLRLGEVRRRTILGALSVYLLIGMFFALVFDGIGLIDSGPFFAQGIDGTIPDYLYFSFTTLTTTGYGDLTAATQLGRTVANVEQLVGQAYLVTIVAFVVSRWRPRRPHTGER